MGIPLLHTYISLVQNETPQKYLKIFGHLKKAIQITRLVGKFYVTLLHIQTKQSDFLHETTCMIKGRNQTITVSTCTSTIINIMLGKLDGQLGAENANVALIGNDECKACLYRSTYTCHTHFKTTTVAYKFT